MPVFATPLSAARRSRSVARCRAWLICLVKPTEDDRHGKQHGQQQLVEWCHDA
jgi:hypothetical protein